ncbi:MAG: hypothetical protein NTW86_15165 [Candidatus Sumerlaeota bacterium]|nr:hypothetical protein [Candidatus Sumerlaeota bacterium]
MSRSKRILERFEGLLRGVREMEAGGDLDGLLTREGDKILKTIYEEALAERVEITAEQAASSPCAVPAVRGGRRAQERGASASDQDGARPDPV